MTARRDLADAEYLKISAWAAAGLRNVDVAARLQINVDTWRKLRGRDERAALAWETGRAELHEKLVSTLIEKALAGEVAPLLFSLKTLFGYREGEALEAESRPTVVINLPAAASPESYGKLIEVHREALPEGESID